MFVPQEPPEPTTRSTLCIRVRDCGGGIPPEHMKDVFSYAFTTVGKAEPGDDDDGGSGSGPYETGTGGGASVISQTGMQTGLGTLAGLGYGLPMVRLSSPSSPQTLTLARAGIDVLPVLWRIARPCDAAGTRGRRIRHAASRSPPLAKCNEGSGIQSMQLQAERIERGAAIVHARRYASTHVSTRRCDSQISHRAGHSTRDP